MSRHPPNETPNMPLIERKPKRIEAHTDAELNAAVDAAVAKFGDDFWLILHGVDAYMHRRQRRDDRKKAAEYDAIRRECDDILSDPWGNS